MDTTSVGTADSVEGTGETPIFDELVGRYGLTLPAEAMVPAQAGNAAVADERVTAGS
jgi:hypothetical protein